MTASTALCLNAIADALVNDRLSLDPPVVGLSRGLRGEFVEIRLVKGQLMFAHRLNSNSGSRLATANDISPDALNAIATQVGPTTNPWLGRKQAQASTFAPFKVVRTSNSKSEIGAVSWHTVTDAAPLTGHQRYNIDWWCRSKKIQTRVTDIKYRHGFMRQVAVIVHNGHHHLVAADGTPFPVNPPRHSARRADKVAQASTPAAVNGGSDSAAAPARQSLGDGGSDKLTFIFHRCHHAAELTGISFDTIRGLCTRKRIHFRRVPGVGKGGFAREVAVITIAGQHHLLAADANGPFSFEPRGRKPSKVAQASTPAVVNGGRASRPSAAQSKTIMEIPPRNSRRPARQILGDGGSDPSATSNDQPATLSSRLAAIRADANTVIITAVNEHLATMPTDSLVTLVGRIEFVKRALPLALPQPEPEHTTPQEQPHA